MVLMLFYIHLALNGKINSLFEIFGEFGKIEINGLGKKLWGGKFNFI